MFYYYESIWNTGEFIFKMNKTIGYIVKLFVVNVLNKLINSFSEENKQKSYIFFQEFQNILNQLSYNEKNINLNLYSNYVEEVFKMVNNEDLNQKITYLTARNFRIVGDLIEVFQYFNALDNQMLKLQQFCRWKATYIEDCLNKNEIPLRGGLNEFIYNPENDSKYFIKFNIDSIDNFKVNILYHEYNNDSQNNQININNNKYPEYNNNIKKSQNDNLNNTNNKTKYPNIPLELNINDNNKVKNRNIKNNLSEPNQIEIKSMDNINIKNNNNSYINNSISTIDSINKKMYTNESSIKKTKETILSFDNNVLEKESKIIVSNNLIAINELKSNRIDNAIQILKNSINIIKQFPKKNEYGFYY